MREIERLDHGITLFARDDYTLRATVGENQIGDDYLALPIEDLQAALIEKDANA